MIFISHSWQDKRSARQVVEALAAAGLPCWFDEQQLDPGTGLRFELESAISKSNIFIYLVSDEANNSEWAQEELKFATNRGDERLSIIPVRLVDNKAELPPRLSDKLYESLEPTTGGAARLAHKLSKMNGHDHVPDGCRLSATVRLEKHRLVHTLTQARNFPIDSEIDVLLLDDRYEALDFLYWAVAEQNFPQDAKGSPQTLTDAVQIVAYIHRQSRNIIEEVRSTCHRFRLMNAANDQQQYFDAGYERILRVMLHRLQWNTTYLRSLRGNGKPSEDFVNTRRLPELFDGHECCFVSDDHTLGSIKVPQCGHPFSSTMKELIPWGLTSPFADMLPSEVGTAVGELLACRFMEESLPSVEMPSPESLKYGLS